MAVLRTGSSGAEVESLQSALNEAGYTPALKADGNYGPLTKAAVEWYQQENNLTVDGIAGSQTLGAIGLQDKAAEGGPADYTDDEPTRFNGLPGQPELWKDKDSGKTYAVYFVPDSEPPIPMMYEVPSTDDLESFFGNQPVAYDKTISKADIDSFGSIIFGTTNDIPAEDGDPWLGFQAKFDRMKETQPWLNDPEVFATFTAAFLEGRPVEEWELQSTDWYQDHTEAQREWMWLNARNPAEADQQLEDDYIKVYNAFSELGLDNVSDELVTYMATQFTHGNWTSGYLSDQIIGLFDPSAQENVDEDLQKFIGDGGIDIGDPAKGVTDVKAAWSKWLGPAYPPTDDQIADWSAKIRKGGSGASDQLTEYLRGQRMAMYPGYENDALSYEDIAGPWRGFATNQWGQQMDETSDTFQQLVKMNDSVEGGKLMRREGMKQGIGLVEQAAGAGLMGQTSGIRRAV